MLPTRVLTPLPHGRQSRSTYAELLFLTLKGRFPFSPKFALPTLVTWVSPDSCSAADVGALVTKTPSLLPATGTSQAGIIHVRPSGSTPSMEHLDTQTRPGCLKEISQEIDLLSSRITHPPVRTSASGIFILCARILVPLQKCPCRSSQLGVQV